MKIWIFLTALALLPNARADKLDDDLAAYGRSGVVKTVSPGREVHLWHWKDLNTVLVGKTDPRDPHWAPWVGKPIQVQNDERVRWYLRYPMNNDYRRGIANGPNNVGPGLYLATDPVSTFSGFGAGPGTDWVLIQLKLAAGMRFLDQFADSGFSAELRSEIRAAGCPADNFISVFTGSVGTSDSAAKCRAVRHRLVPATGTVAYRYTYSAAALTGCGARKAAAFVMVDRDDDNDRAFDDDFFWNKAMVFRPDSDRANDSHGEMRLILEDLFARATAYASYKGQPWPRLQGQRPAQTDMEAWMRRDLISCGNGFPED